MMLDHKHRSSFAEQVNAIIDTALEADRSTSPPRNYLGSSRLGHSCERALQFEFAGIPKDDGSDFNGRALRVFAIGHALEELAIHWLHTAGFNLVTRLANGEQLGFSAAGGRIRGHVDGIIIAAPQQLNIGVPALWECKTMHARSWREIAAKGVAIAKPVYASQIALYQAYMEDTVPGISTNPAFLTVINKDTAELYHELVPFDAALAQTMSDRAVRILQATDAGELLPRIAREPEFYVCRMCPWTRLCWNSTTSNTTLTQLIRSQSHHLEHGDYHDRDDFTE